MSARKLRHRWDLCFSFLILAKLVARWRIRWLARRPAFWSCENLFPSASIPLGCLVMPLASLCICRFLALCMFQDHWSTKQANNLCRLLVASFRTSKTKRSGDDAMSLVDMIDESHRMCNPAAQLGELSMTRGSAKGCRGAYESSSWFPPPHPFVLAFGSNLAKPMIGDWVWSVALSGAGWLV